MRHFKNGLERKSEFSLGEAYNHYSRIIYSLIEPKKAEKIENPFIFMETAPGKIMGLCAYGNKDKIKLPDIFEITYDNYFPTIYTNPYSDIRQVQKYEPVDLAAWLQYQFEEALLKYFDNLAYFGFSLDNLCLAGGCALNVLANKKILDSGIFKDVYVFPGANDSGLPFGGAIYLVHEYETENNTEFKIKLPENIGSLGRAYSVEEILEVVKQ
jgi:predicted NodU family carbamoyl transferase